MRRVMVFDHEDSIVGELSPDEVLSLVRTEVVNGEHTLTIRTTRVLEIGWRILTKDGMGKWREHVVYGADAMHASGDTAVGEYYCVWSLMHDLAGTTVSAMPGVQSPVYASVALDAVLGGTSRWVKGDVENTAQAGASMYDMSGWDAMSVLLENWGGEIDAAIEVGASGVTARKVDYYEMQGSSEALRRYDFGADMKSVRRRIEDCALYCRISPRGKGEQTEGGGYGRKITIASVNGGKDYLEYAPMVSAARLPDGNGGWEYPTRIVENSSCETPADLLAWGQSMLEAYCTPNVTYEVDVAQASAEGADMHGVALGDVVHLVDRRFGDGLRLSGRVSSMTVDMLDERNVKVTIGSVSEWLSEALAAFGARFDAVSSKVDAAVAAQSHMATAAYVTELLRRVNAEISASNGWTYIVPGVGIITYSVPVTDPAVGDEAKQVIRTGGSASVTWIGGGGIKIANSLDSQGDWDWRTLIVAGHVAADLVTAAAITAGFIGSASGNCMIDLDNNVMRLGSTQGTHFIVSSSAVTMKYGSQVLGEFGLDSLGRAAFKLGDITTMGYDGIESSFTDYNGTHAFKLSRQSLVIGDDCTTSGNALCFVLGEGSKATERDSFAFGHACEATEWATLAVGYKSKATAYWATAIGHGARANQPNLFAIGPWNVGATGHLFEVGNGIEDNRRNAFYVNDLGNAWLKGTLAQASDRRLKEHVAYLGEDAVGFVQALKPALFERDGVRHIGFYAQDVAEADQWDTATVEAQEGVDESLDFDPLSLDYTALIAPTVAALQKALDRIEALEARVAQLESRVEGDVTQAG